MVLWRRRGAHTHRGCGCAGTVRSSFDNAQEVGIMGLNINIRALRYGYESWVRTIVRFGRFGCVGGAGRPKWGVNVWVRPILPTLGMELLEWGVNVDVCTYWCVSARFVCIWWVGNALFWAIGAHQRANGFAV